MTNKLANYPQNTMGELLPNCCRASEQGLLWKGEPTVKELRAIGTTLRSIERGNSWWWGDYLNKIVDAHIAELEAEARKQGTLFDAGHGANHVRAYRYIAEYASFSGMDADTLRRRKSVAAFYPMDSRTTALPFEHYREAQAIGTLEDALELLRHAERERMTVPELRAHMRERRGMRGDGLPPIDSALGRDLADVVHWSSRMLGRADSLPIEGLRELYGHLMPTVSLVDRIRQRLGIGGASGSSP